MKTVTELTTPRPICLVVFRGCIWFMIQYLGQRYKGAVKFNSDFYVSEYVLRSWAFPQRQKDDSKMMGSHGCEKCPPTLYFMDKKTGTERSSDSPKVTQLETVVVRLESRLSGCRAEITYWTEDLDRQRWEVGEVMAGGEICVIEGPEGGLAPWRRTCHFSYPAEEKGTARGLGAWAGSCGDPRNSRGTSPARRLDSGAQSGHVPGSGSTM